MLVAVVSIVPFASVILLGSLSGQRQSVEQSPHR
jgi:hypothetical protein